MKAEGVRSGVPDLCLPVPRGTYHGLYIENKAGKGNESDNQKTWIAFLKQQGYYVVTSYSPDIAKQVLITYLQWPRTRTVTQRVWEWLQLPENKGKFPELDI